MELRIEGLTKVYKGGVRALDNVSLTIPHGLYGLLGPNGAGKSTLMRTIATLQEPDSGFIHLGSLDVLRQKEKVREVLGIYLRTSAFIRASTQKICWITSPCSRVSSIACSAKKLYTRCCIASICGSIVAKERNCTAGCMDTYISYNSDWVNVDTVISTSGDQIAIAPGSLVRQWQQGGRNFYEYKLDHYALNFYSFLSARYEVRRSKWNGMEVEVYYLKEHPWNVPKMVNSVEKSFAYYTTNYGPYFNKQARIIEFPRVASFAQAFPGTMPYSESIGFIASIEKPDDIDMVYYVVAHEMAHQWWAHQVVGANMEGATSLSETLAQYSALMVMEKEYGRETMRKFMQYEIDRYLRSRGTERFKEKPLMRVDASQGYIHYRKGSVVLYYLRDMIGEDAINRALRKILASYGYAQPPYPASWVLVDALRAETPQQYQYLLKDLFEDITLFSNRALTAKAKKRPDGKYDVTVEVETHKYKADAKGTEAEVPVDDGSMLAHWLHRKKASVTESCLSVNGCI